MTIKQKKEFAKIQYVNLRLSQKEAAEKAGVSAKTMNQWVKAEKWDDLRVSFIVTKEEQLRRIYSQINEINTFIETKEEGQRYANSKEADTLVKLTAAAKTLELDTSISETIEVFKNYTNWLKQRDLKEVQNQMPFFDDYVKHILK